MSADVNHKPADITPLPWRALEVNNGAKRIVDPGAPITAANGLATARAWESFDWVLGTPRAAQNAAYIVHACNAYPRLIEALQRCARMPGGFTSSEAAGLLESLGEES